ncbi:hypothetical protein [Frigidibacter sp. MR17.24]|uniref:hypothetical protein n=1 Tax=Frigidibacter sp. MR17.24 TaxID=3127345 RepID=UPI0030131DAB
MRVCLFIGHHKVGSTALQAFLSRNAGALARAGILYPPVESEGMAILLRQLADPEAPAQTSFNAREPHNALVFRMKHEALGAGVPPWHPGLPSVHQMLLSIANQVRFLQPRAIILCAESFSTLADRPALIDRLAQLFASADVSLHCTLRRPDRHLASWHAQRLRFGEAPEPLSGAGLDDYLDTIHVDYARVIEAWRAAFPRARLSLRRYDEVLAAGGSIEDFRLESGLDFPDGLEAPERLNPSLHPALIAIGRRITLQSAPGQAIPVIEALIEASSGLGDPAPREVELLGPANRARLAARFAPIAARLDAVAGRRLFPDLDGLAQLRPVDEAQAQEALLPRVLARLPRDVARLVRRATTEDQPA